MRIDRLPFSPPLGGPARRLSSEEPYDPSKYQPYEPHEHEDTLGYGLLYGLVGMIGGAYLGGSLATTNGLVGVMVGAGAGLTLGIGLAAVSSNK